MHGIDLSVNMVSIALERSIDIPQDALVGGVCLDGCALVHYHPLHINDIFLILFLFVGVI